MGMSKNIQQWRNGRRKKPFEGVIWTIYRIPDFVHRMVMKTLYFHQVHAGSNPVC